MYLQKSSLIFSVVRSQSPKTVTAMRGVALITSQEGLMFEKYCRTLPGVKVSILVFGSRGV